MVRIYIEAHLYPTEEPEKVRRAIKTFYNGKIAEREAPGYVVLYGESSDLSSIKPLYEAIRVSQIIAAVRSYLYRRKRGNRVEILLHKQAAYMGKISLIDNERESPLGAIRIIIEADDIKSIIDWLAPSL
ncbi:MAG: hypothetical protein GXO43_10025 [Crenarchaeota archaeon]|nr:hypothetical protein [Thermoproteota archaeon]